MRRRRNRQRRRSGDGFFAGRTGDRRALFGPATIERCEERYLLSIAAPSNIPTTVFNITSYGAVDTATDNSAAIQAAINAAAANTVGGHKGGIVEIPAASQAWMSGPINLASNVDLQVDAGAELQALNRTNWIATYSASTNFITGNNLTNFEITGAGTIDGNGGGGSSNWWNNSSSTRPDLIHIENSSTYAISGLTIQNSPKEHVVLDSSNDVIINGITISAPSTSPNTDGIDPAGSNILIENCNISDGDDDIAVKPQDSYCSNITITNCTIGSGHGISVGGETNDGLDGMTVTDITFNGTTNGLRLKAGRGSGGLVENVTYSNITMTNVEYPFYISSYYVNGSDTQPSDPASDSGQAVNSTTPIWENITFSDITSTDTASNASAGVLYAVPEAPMTNIVFDNVKITAHTGMEINNARNVTFGDGSKITVSSGNDIIGTSSYPTPYNDTIVPESYSDQDIGSPSVVSTTLFNPDTGIYSVISETAGISATSDQFNFASTSITGNATYDAEVTSLSTSNAGAVAGVMFRDSSDTASSAFADAVVTPGSGVEFQWRSSNGGTEQSASVAGIAAPVYLEIVRSGSDFSAFYSTNGTSWTQIGTTQAIAMSSTALVGLAVSSGSASSSSTADFSDLAGPSFTAAPTSSPQPVTGTTANFSVSASESGSNLTYNWSALSVPTGVATPTFSVNGTGAANNTTATFYGAGTYLFSVTVTDSDNVSVTAYLGVAVNQTPTSITITPSSATVGANGTQVFTAAATDQFGNAIGAQIFSWSLASGVGTVNSSFGLYTSPATPGAAVVKATSGSASATATVNSSGPTLTQAAAADPNPVTGTTTALSAAATENGSGSALTYTWSATSVPNGVTAPTYSVNGTNAAANTIATFYGAGSYSFMVTITDPSNNSITSSVNVTVNQTPTNVMVSPSSITDAVDSQQQFSASATDQFGNAISSPSFTWSITGTSDGNSISSSGLATLGSTPGNFTVTAQLGSASNIAQITAAAAPSISSFQINDGSAQRSMIDSLTLTFNEAVNIGNGAITLDLLSQTGGSSTPMSFTLATPDGGTTWVLTFTGGSYIGSSLPNGAYQLSVSASGVSGAAGGLNMSSNQSYEFWRLYGDFQGNGVVNSVDFGSFATVFGTSTTPSNWFMDYDGNGVINSVDFGAFAVDFGTSISIPAVQTPTVMTPSPTTTTNTTTSNSPAIVVTKTTTTPTTTKKSTATFAAVSPAVSNTASDSAMSSGSATADLADTNNLLDPNGRRHRHSESNR